ncbi:hypothetical protein AB0D13_23665 [Streptomyces sp. NPDC048430]
MSKDTRTPPGPLRRSDHAKPARAPLAWPIWTRRRCAVGVH